MGKISTYSIDALPTLNDKVIGSDADDSLATKNYLLSDIIGLIETPAYEQVLFASSFADQNPTGQNVPHQIEFGAAQSTSDIDLDANGNVTFLSDGNYFFESFGNVERQGNSGGIAQLMYRILINGTQHGITRGVDLNSVGIMIPIIISEPLPNISAGDILSFEILRDANGVNQGSLYPHVISGGVWQTVPSASITIWKLS